MLQELQAEGHTASDLDLYTQALVSLHLMQLPLRQPFCRSPDICGLHKAATCTPGMVLRHNNQHVFCGEAGLRSAYVYIHQTQQRATDGACFKGLPGSAAGRPCPSAQ